VEAFDIHTGQVWAAKIYNDEHGSSSSDKVARVRTLETEVANAQVAQAKFQAGLDLLSSSDKEKVELVKKLTDQLTDARTKEVQARSELVAAEGELASLSSKYENAVQARRDLMLGSPDPLRNRRRVLVQRPLLLGKRLQPLLGQFQIALRPLQRRDRFLQSFPERFGLGFLNLQLRPNPRRLSVQALAPRRLFHG
jgi:hypothetical protein